MALLRPPIEIRLGWNEDLIVAASKLTFPCFFRVSKREAQGRNSMKDGEKGKNSVKFYAFLIGTLLEKRERFRGALLKLNTNFFATYKHSANKLNAAVAPSQLLAQPTFPPLI